MIGKKIKSFRKRDLKNLSLGKAISIIKDKEKLNYEIKIQKKKKRKQMRISKKKYPKSQK